ncbi:hypothetical protein Pcinc_015586 [Petrolisthes cinctipes]|uniref:Nucleoporin NUP35 n=1 Tax=Petrolisthes cinctipes TaxID=88211 RepID=A0AAE1FSR7_PETCI|nr:hypothetical protein Pcinc_015586 [Petrolisthes cinctipes]
MTLGSPVGSPAATPHAPPTGPAGGSPFLPSYLMGDVASPAALSGRLGGSGAGGGGGGGGGGGVAGSTSPNKTTATRQFSASTTVSTPGSPQPNKDPFFTTRLGPDKPGGGPPIQGLIGVRGPSTLPQSPILSARLGSPYIDQRVLGTPISGSPQAASSTYYSTPGSPYTSQHTPGPLYSSPQVFTPSREHHHHSFLGQESLQTSTTDSVGGGVEDSTWVTVFGFPPAAASYILTQFTQLGTVTRHHNPGSGNWMHLKYQTKLQARKALSKNGKVYSGNIMIGVVTCSDKTIMGEKENLSSTSATVLSPAVPTTPKANMRPLTQAYQTVHAEHEVVPKVSTPKKNDGLVSRAMQHLLGM